VVAATFGNMFLIKSFPAPGSWIAASVIVALFIASVPPMLRMQRRFLCSTVWAKARGYEADRIKLFSFSRKNLRLVLIFAGVAGLLIYGQNKLVNRLSGTEELTQSLKDETRLKELANSPQKLRSLPNASVIEVGMAEPQTPWAWQELENRARAGRMSETEAGKIVDSLALWIRRDYPDGYDQPLGWIGNLLEELNRRNLVAQTNASAFLVACCGNPSLEPLPRVRADEQSFELTCKLRSPWWGQLFGFRLLNEINSITIDGRKVSVRNVFGNNWDQQQYVGEVGLTNITDGPHVLRCEVESALVLATNMLGLPGEA
jgi:hypothetical protein